MSTFVSNNDQRRVAETNKAPFKLKPMNDATKNVMQGAIEVWHNSAHSYYDEDDVTNGDGDMAFVFIDGDGNLEDTSTAHVHTVQQPAHKATGTSEHEATVDKSDNDVSQCESGSGLSLYDNAPANDNGFVAGAFASIPNDPADIEEAEVSGEESDEFDCDLDLDEDEQHDFVQAIIQEIEEKLGAIAALNQQMAVQQNFILKKRIQAKINSLEDEMRLKLASLEDSQTTETESVDKVSQYHTSGGKSPVTQRTDSINAAGDEKSMAS